MAAGKKTNKPARPTTEREEYIVRAQSEAARLLEAVRKMDVEEAATFIAEYPPSAEAIACLALIGERAGSRARAQAGGLASQRKRYAADRLMAFSWWKEWQTYPSLYASKNAFALVMIDKTNERLRSQATIAQWCRDWEKGIGLPAE